MFGSGGGPAKLDAEALEAFFDAIDRLDLGELERLGAAWHAISKEEHEAAWAQVRDAAARDGLGRDLDRVRARALAWTSRGSNRPGYLLPDDRTWIEAKIEAAEAIVDGALAAALGDRLDARTRETLLGSLREARGPEHPSA